MRVEGAYKTCARWVCFFRRGHRALASACSRQLAAWPPGSRLGGLAGRPTFLGPQDQTVWPLYCQTKVRGVAVSLSSSPHFGAFTLPHRPYGFSFKGLGGRPKHPRKWSAALLAVYGSEFGVLGFVLGRGSLGCSRWHGRFTSENVFTMAASIQGSEHCSEASRRAFYV